MLHVRHRTLAPLRRGLASLAALAMLGGACSDPEIPVPAPSDASEEAEPDALPEPGPVASVPDPRDADLMAAASVLLTTLEALETGFGKLARASAQDDLEDTTASLLDLLSADPRWAIEVDCPDNAACTRVAPLLPGPETSREETVDYGDAFTSLLATARDAGAAGSAFVDVLRDPIVGDVGSWQRDPAGVLDTVVARVRGIRDITAAEAAVAELAGEGPRALAWALLAQSAVARGDLEQVRAYGERGAVHVELMLDAVRPLLQEPTDEEA